ncbi:MAG: hypothetical protein QOI62_1409 [Solirubrobacteraceae bacterium]|jgi:hypothetical protein|nr:hypothetical protein [Solirubrobacteraceae bacterium]
MAGPEPFTWGQYSEYLRLALSNGYRFGPLDGSTSDRGDANEQVVYLRHDVDFSLRWVLPMAELEAEHGVRATYCFLLDSPYYPSESSAFDETVQAILEMGHWLGLHFDATPFSSDDEVARRVADAAEALGQRFATDVVSVSFHWPGRRPVSQIVLPGGLVNTYGPRFFSEIGYASDSNQDWRGTDLAEVLTSRRHARLQLLIHPVWWRDTYSPILDKLTELAEELGMGLDEVMTVEQRALIDEAAA